LIVVTAPSITTFTFIHHHYKSLPTTITQNKIKETEHMKTEPKNKWPQGGESKQDWRNRGRGFPPHKTTAANSGYCLFWLSPSPPHHYRTTIRPPLHVHRTTVGLSSPSLTGRFTFSRKSV
jgi:hypothetical protein